MNECLVTKLKSSVDDNNLPFLGGFVAGKRTDASSVVNAWSNITTTEPIKVVILNDGAFYKHNSTEIDPSVGKEKTYPAGSCDIYVSPGTRFVITPRYGITSIEIYRPNVDISQLTYMSGLESINLSGYEVKGTIDAFKGYSNLTSVNLGDSNYQIEGNIESLKNSIDLTSVVLTKSNVTGSISTAFGKCTKLTHLNIGDTEASGSIESFVAEQIAAGRTTGQVAMPYAKLCKNVTFNGSSLSDNPALPSSADSNKFSWTSDGTITWS